MPDDEHTSSPGWVAHRPLVASHRHAFALVGAVVIVAAFFAEVRAVLPFPAWVAYVVALHLVAQWRRDALAVAGLASVVLTLLVLGIPPSGPHRNLLSSATGCVALAITGWLISRHANERHERAQLIEYAPVGLIAVEPGSGRIEFANAKTCELFGYSAEELKGQSLELLVPDRARESHRELRQRMPSMPIPHKMASAREVAARTRDGREIFVQVILNSWTVRGRTSVLAAVVDVTARRALEATSVRLEHELQAFIESMPAAVSMKSTDGRYLLANKHFAAIYGIPADGITGKTDQEIFPSELADVLHESDQLVMRASHETLSEDTVHRPDGTRVYSTIKFPLRNERNDVYATAAIALDITDRVEAQQQLARYARELERSNEDLQQFAYVASHDLQEPLRMVSGYCHLLSTRYKGRFDQDADEFLQFATEGAERMKRLIDDLLAYSRLGSRPTTPGDVSMDAVVADAIHNLQLAIAESEARIDVPPLPNLYGDRLRLVQLFQNLLSNALKFRGTSPPHIQIAAERSGEHWQFSVRDNGIGFNPAQADRIFLMFRRLHARGTYPGTGIGLALCRRIVEQHGGRIWAESAVGTGSTFVFTLRGGTGS